MSLQTVMTPIPVEPTPSRVNPEAITVEILAFDVPHRTVDVRVTDHGALLFENAVGVEVTAGVLNLTELRNAIALLVEDKRLRG